MCAAPTARRSVLPARDVWWPLCPGERGLEYEESGSGIALGGEDGVTGGTDGFAVGGGSLQGGEPPVHTGDIVDRLPALAVPAERRVSPASSRYPARLNRADLAGVPSRRIECRAHSENGTGGSPDSSRLSYADTRHTNRTARAWTRRVDSPPVAGDHGRPTCDGYTLSAPDRAPVLERPSGVRVVI